MRVSITSAVVIAAIALIAAGALLGARLGTAGNDAADPPVPAAVSDRSLPQAHVDLEREALALLPSGISVSRAQSTRERRCLGDGEYEPCAEFSVDAFGQGRDRRPPYEERARSNGWRVVRFDAERGGGTLRLARGRLQARISLTSYGFDRVRVSDPTRRRPVAEPVAVDPASASSARASFIAAANRACKRLKATFATAPATGESSSEVFRKLLVAFEAFVADVGNLPVPDGDERAVQRLRAELRKYTKVLHTLQTAEEDEALTAAAGIVVQGNRAEEAMRQYGLRGCKGITGVAS